MTGSILARMELTFQEIIFILHHRHSVKKAADIRTEKSHQKRDANSSIYLSTIGITMGLLYLEFFSKYISPQR
ncbi:MAG: hypothetical protein LBB12_03470 [Holosporaceae bacterium]|nr:hypothetical protein [Holosporaceae bacterium]